MDLNLSIVIGQIIYGTVKNIPYKDKAGSFITFRLKDDKKTYSIKVFDKKIVDLIAGKLNAGDLVYVFGEKKSEKGSDGNWYQYVMAKELRVLFENKEKQEQSQSNGGEFWNN